MTTSSRDGDIASKCHNETLIFVAADISDAHLSAESDDDVAESVPGRPHTVAPIENAKFYKYVMFQL